MMKPHVVQPDNSYTIPKRCANGYTGRKENEMKQYRVIDEYVSMWGDDDEIIVDSNEIERLSREWDVPVEMLLEQVEEIS